MFLRVKYFISVYILTGNTGPVPDCDAPRNDVSPPDEVLDSCFTRFPIPKLPDTIPSRGSGMTAG
jgi:hypothetical protein